MNKQLKAMKLNLLAGNNPMVSKDRRIEGRLSARVSSLQSVQEEELRLKPIRGLENIVSGKRYIEVYALRNKNMWMSVGTIVGEPFAGAHTGSLFVEFMIDGHRFYPKETSLHDRFVVGDKPHNNNRFFAYTPQNLEILIDMVERKAFDEYCTLLRLCEPSNRYRVPYFCQPRDTHLIARGLE
jgi:hypothetical protein